MIRKLVVLVGLILMSKGISFSADVVYSVTLNDEQQKGLAFAMDKYNAAGAAAATAEAPFTPLTKEGYMQYIISSAMNDYYRQLISEFSSNIQNAIKAAYTAKDEQKLDDISVLTGVARPDKKP